MGDGQRPQRDDPSPDLLLRGCLGIALALGGLVLGGEWGLGLMLVGTVVTVSGGLMFAVEAFERWRRARQ